MAPVFYRPVGTLVSDWDAIRMRTSLPFERLKNISLGNILILLFFSGFSGPVFSQYGFGIFVE